MKVRPFNYSDVGPTNWYHKKLSKSNQYCPYCGVYVGDGKVESNKEHLIARQFIPKIMNDGLNFNFIFRACVKCNTAKSNFERHISSVSLYNSPAKFENANVLNIAEDKSLKDFHPATKKKVRYSFEKIDIKADERMEFGVTIPPQVMKDYSSQLAYYHVQGLFSLLTSKNPLDMYGGMRILVPASQFGVFDSFISSDWGNPVLAEIVNRTADWPCFAYVNSAAGFFKAIIKCAPTGTWFWALEWNKYIRIIGSIDNPGVIPAIFQNLPAENWSAPSKQADGSVIRIKPEIPLLPRDDTLFSPAVWGGEAHNEGGKIT